MPLIKCTKIIKKTPPQRQRLISGSYRLDFEVANDQGDIFNIFSRQLVKLPADFSIGLKYKEYTLIRVNGWHGLTKKGFYSSDHHRISHLHLLTEEDIRNRQYARPSGTQSTQGNYFDFWSAFAFFCRYCGIINFEQYFSNNMQTSLFDKEW